MLEGCSTNKNPNKNNHQFPLGHFEPEAKNGTALVAVEALPTLPSITTLPPIQTINKMVER
jgi:hypothetical protein